MISKTLLMVDSSTAAFSLFLATWSLLCLLDAFLKAKNFPLYLKFIERTGLVIRPFHIRWYTSRAQHYGNRILGIPLCRRLLDHWFTIGIGFGMIAIAGILLLLTKLLFSQLLAILFSPAPLAKTRATQEEITLVPLIPGWNIPWSHLPLFLIVLALVGVVHEMGHALAACQASVPVRGFGVFVLVIYPGAFTEIDNDALESQSCWRQLKIYSAGIWNNVGLAVLFAVCLSALPCILSPLYATGDSVTVLWVLPNSGLAGSGGLQPGQQITAINNCQVNDLNSWSACLKRIAQSSQDYCVPKSEFDKNRSATFHEVNGEMQCCDVNRSASHLCFYSQKLNETTLTNIFEYACLPARYVTDFENCTLHCSPKHLQMESNRLCIRPAIFNNTKLMKFFTTNSDSKPVLFIGFSSEVLQAVTVSPFRTRLNFIPIKLPYAIELCCKYVITFSLALAVLNAVPCYGLDGQFMATVLVDLIGDRSPQWKRRKRCIYQFLIMYGTVLLILNLCLALWKFFNTWH